MTYEEVVESLRTKRKELGLSHREVELLTAEYGYKVSYPTVWRLLNPGPIQDCSGKTLIALCKALGVSYQVQQTKELEP